MHCCRHCGNELRVDIEVGIDGPVTYVYACGCDESLEELGKQAVNG